MGENGRKTAEFVKKWDRTIVFIIGIIFSTGMAYMFLKMTVQAAVKEVVKIETKVKDHSKTLYKHAIFIARQDEVNKAIRDLIKEIRRGRR